jgi:hypothetical protein
MPAPFDSAFLAILIGLPYAVVIARFVQVRGSVSRRQPVPIRGAVPFRTVQRRGTIDAISIPTGEPIASSGGLRGLGSRPIAMRIAARQAVPARRTA